MGTVKTQLQILLLVLAQLAAAHAVDFWRYPSLQRNRPVSGVPYIRPIRRHVVNFLPGQRGTVTVVYRSDVTLDVRWFRKAEGLPKAEIENMLSTKGDSSYSVTSAGSGDVRATTLIWEQVGSDFPYNFVTCFSANDTLFWQYQLDTEIARPTRVSPDPPPALPTMHWVSIPDNVTSFHFYGNLRVTCAAILAPEVDEDVEKLIVYKTHIKARSRNKYGHMVVSICDDMHKLRKEYFHEPGKYSYAGQRRRLPYNYARYQMQVKVLNATREDQGMYVCELSRQSERAYVSSWTQMGRLERRPLVELVPCSGKDLSDRLEPFNVHMTKAVPTCFSCRASGYPSPIISVQKGNRELLESEFIHADHHVNVAYGGLPEVTYTFFKPTVGDMGSYRCLATSGRLTVSVKFRVTVRDSPRN